MKSHDLIFIYPCVFIYILNVLFDYFMTMKNLKSRFRPLSWWYWVLCVCVSINERTRDDFKMDNVTTCSMTKRNLDDWFHTEGVNNAMIFFFFSFFTGFEMKIKDFSYGLFEDNEGCERQFIYIKYNWTYGV